MVKVTLWGGLRDLADGAEDLEMNADTISDVFNQLTKAYPGLAAELESNVSVAVDGQVYREALFVPLEDGAEVFLLPRLQGG